MKSTINKRAIAVVLAAAMVVEGISATTVMAQDNLGEIQAVSVSGNPVENAPELTLGQDYSLTLDEDESDYVYLKFIPETSGNYVFRSKGNFDPCGTLYDKNLNQLANNDDSENSWNFWIEQELTAGESYYLKVENNDGGTATFTVRVNLRSEESMSEGIQLEYGVETPVQLSGDSAYQCFYSIMPETGSYVLKFTNVQGSCEMSFGLSSESKRTGCDITQDDTERDLGDLTGGTDYEISFELGDSESFSATIQLVNLSQTGSETLVLGEEKQCRENVDYQFTPEKSGFYKYLITGNAWNNWIYNENMELCYVVPDYKSDGDYSFKDAVVYLKAGQTYSFRCGWFSSGTVLVSEEEYVDDPQIELAERYGEDFSYSLDEEGVLTLQGEGEMPVEFEIHRGICNKIRKVVIDEGITSVSNFLFVFCPSSSLTQLVIPGSLTEIGSQAFEGCSNLSEIAFSGEDNLTYIGKDAFAGTAWYQSQGEFPALDGMLLGYEGNGGEVQVPDVITNIGVYSLAYHDNIDKATVPGSVSNVAYCSFESCTALEDVVIEDGVQSIGESAFLNCNQLKSITIPKSVIEIEKTAIGYQWDFSNDGWWEKTAEKNSTLPTIRCYAGSAAYTYAVENEIPYQVVDAGSHTHDYRSKMIKDPTCTTVGESTNTCTICGDTYTEEIPATGHTIVTDPAIPATCTTEGKTEGSHCSVCNEVLTIQQTVPATSHNYTTAVTKATTESDGSITKKCVVCGAVESTTVIPHPQTVELSKETYIYWKNSEAIHNCKGQPGEGIGRRYGLQYQLFRWM